MSNPSGFDFDDMFSRLHIGVRGLQHWRNNQRARFAGASPTAAASRPTTVVAAAPNHTAANDATGGPLEPQGFVAVGGRLLPVFSDAQVRGVPDTAPSINAAPSTPMTEPPPAPPPTPTVEPLRATRLSTVAALKMSPPTPPACLQRAPMPADHAEPAPTPTTNPEPAQTRPMHAQEAMPLRNSEGEAARLEQVHAEHRGLLATLLSEHRATLRDQAEADAAQQNQIVRELLIGHRAELEAHAEAMRQLLGQHREAMQKIVATTDHAAGQHDRAITALHELLADQAKAQAQAHEQTEQHIGDLAGVIGDLGETVGHLAAATYERKPTFAPPQLAAIPWPPPTPSNEPVQSIREPAADLNAASVRITGPAATPTQASRGAPPRAQRHEASHTQARVDEFVGEYDEDDPSEDLDDPDDPPPRARLSPITPLDRITASEPAHV